MLKQDLLLRHPLRCLGYENDDVLSRGGFGAVLARAGVGKTALLVQLAINAMLRGRKVLHVSLHDPVGKVVLWYEELFHHLAEEHQIERRKALWEDILPNRFVLTFKVEGFSVPRLEERLNDLMTQEIFRPDMIIIDGLTFDDGVRDNLHILKALAERLALTVWFTVPIHRHLEEGRAGLPLPMVSVGDLFEVVLLLATEGNEIRIRSLKPSPSVEDIRACVLDPQSMLIRNAS